MTGLSLLAVAATALSLTNRFVTLDFDASGRIASLRERGTGRELVEKPVDFVVARPEKGRSLVPESFSVGGDGSLVWTFPGDAGSVRFSVSPFDGGWTFSCVGFSGRGVRALRCAPTTAALKCRTPRTCCTSRLIRLAVSSAGGPVFPLVRAAICATCSRA